VGLAYISFPRLPSCLRVPIKSQPQNLSHQQKHCERYLATMAPKRKSTQKADDDDTTDWASLTVVNLKAELAQRGLPVSGNKTALVDRLNAADGDGAGKEMSHCS